ncbi:MAG TPA: YihY/virulence factor BrkB family protein [Anaeromyxobacter sp.]|nr:YihY/virulence factor BrkB family protein [Anaeromyxobacter sp.]
MRLPGNGMSWKEFGKGVWGEISRDGVTDLAATVTYYGVLALFPFVLFLVALAGLFITPADAEKMVGELARVAPGAATQIIADRIRQLGQQQNVTLVGFGALGALWAASGGVTAVIRALNVAYDVREGRPFWKVRGLAVLMTVVASALGLAAALVAVGAGPLGERIGGPIGTAMTWLRLPVAGIIMMFVWAVMYWALPDVEQEFKFITPGSAVGVVLWVLASYGFSKYVAAFGGYDKTYGALGGVIVLLLWMWISSLVLLVGAEINAFIEHASPEGKREGAKRMDDSGTEPKARAAAFGETIPAHARPADEPGRGVEARLAPAAARPPRLRGIAAIAAGFVAGVLVARREA